MELYWIDKIFAKWRNFEVVANFFVKTVTGSMLYQPISQWHSLYFELLIELVAQKLTELWWFTNLAYFLTWWPSSMTYLFVNVTYWNCSPIPYVDQVWWWYVKAFMSYAWQNGQTNRQTDKRTYLQKLKILASNKRERDSKPSQYRIKQAHMKIGICLDVFPACAAEHIQVINHSWSR